MQTRIHLPHYLSAIVLFLLLKVGYTYATTNHLSFLLAPTNYGIELSTGSTAVYQPDVGYFHSALHCSIDKSCSGFNFWLLSFLVFTHAVLRHAPTARLRWLALPFALLLAYGFTVFVNTSRILASLAIQKQTTAFFVQQQLVHEAIGIVTNLTFLLLAYLALDNMFIHIKKNAKPT